MIQAHDQYHMTNHTTRFLKNYDIIFCALILGNHTCCTKKFEIKYTWLLHASFALDVYQIWYPSTIFIDLLGYYI